MSSTVATRLPEGAPPTVQPAPPPPQGSSLSTAGSIVLAIVALYFGQEIFIPFALAILLSFILAPLVVWLRRIKLPKVAAVVVAVSLAFVVLAGVSLVVGSQLVQLAGNLPSYEQTIRNKIRSLQASAPGGGVVERVTTTIQDLSKELSQSEGQKPPGSSAGGRTPAREPIPVTIEAPALDPIAVIRTVIGPLLAPLATAGLVTVFVIFVLLEREDLRDRFIKLIGGGDLQRSTEALNDAAERVSRYLLMQLVVNVTYGIPIGIGLYFIGVPNAVLWGLLATVLRFIPYLGPFLAALFPLALAFAVDPGWSMLVWVIGLFLLVELISNNIVEPLLYGSSTGLSSLAIIMAAIFWTTLWGPAGLFLSTPLTVCLAVMGRYVPQLEFLGVLLGSDPVLTPAERLYQRLLAGNIEEAVEIAETYVDEHSSRAFYDEVAVPALRLAENDRQRSTTDVTYRRVVADTAVCVVREVAEHVREQNPAALADRQGPAASRSAAPDAPVRVLCIAGRTELDRAASEMLAEVLGEQGIRARVLPPITVSQDAIGQLELDGVEIVCLSYLNPQPQVYARYVSRRLKRRVPGLKTVIGFWNPAPEVAQDEDLMTRMAADAVVGSIEAAVQQIDLWLDRPALSCFQAPAVPDNEEQRLAVLRELGLTSRGKAFDEIASKVAHAFEAPIALVSLIDEDHQLWPGAVGLPSELDAARQAPRQTSVCGHVVAGDDLLVVEDVTKDPRFAENPFLLEKGVRFYAGAPLRTSSGFVLGSLCVVDTKPRSFSEQECNRLQAMADEVMARIEEECRRQQAADLPSAERGDRTERPQAAAS